MATVGAMIDMNCRAHHGSAAVPCADCLQIREYASTRIDRCRFGAAKPVCAKCPVHCYRPDMRRLIRDVMRFSGPRMLLRHPLLALLHMIDGIRTR